jgi:hypothetical protein
MKKYIEEWKDDEVGESEEEEHKLLIFNFLRIFRFFQQPRFLWRSDNRIISA